VVVLVKPKQDKGEYVMKECSKNAAVTHTPGPWWLDDDGFVAAGSSDTYRTVADPRCMIATDMSGEMDANARLIAAAPDLLAAARNAANVLAGLAIGDLDTVTRDSPALQQLRAAIAQATQP
jgi:hypothetical protein